MRLALPALFCAMLSFSALAQEKPVKIVVPFTAGGATDTVARGLAARLATVWDRTVVVENRPGAAGTIGARYVASAPPDGNTLVIVASGHAINELVHKQLPYDTVEDFTAVAQVVDVPNVLLVPKNSPYRTVKDLVKASKESPNGLTYGTSGVGTSVHLAGELFKAMSGANMEVIFFKGDSESLVNLVGGHIPVSVNTVPGAKQQIDAGNVRALGVTTKQRVPVLGNVPTISEAGVENYEMSTWFGILGPKGMKKEDVQRINADIRKAMNDPELSRQLTSQGMIVNVGTPEEFDGLIRGEIKKWRPIVEKLGLKKDS